MGGPAAPRRSRGDRGSAAVEFALVAPLLMVLAIAVVQVALALHVRATLTAAAAEGARAASLAGADPRAGVLRARELLADNVAGSVVREVTAAADGDRRAARDGRAHRRRGSAGRAARARGADGRGPRAAGGVDVMHAPRMTGRRCRRGDGGSAAIEFIVIGIGLLVPLVYLASAAATVQAAAFASAQAVREAGRAFSSSATPAQGRRLAEAAARLAFADHGLELPSRCAEPGLHRWPVPEPRVGRRGGARVGGAAAVAARHAGSRCARADPGGGEAAGADRRLPRRRGDVTS